MGYEWPPSACCTLSFPTPSCLNLGPYGCSSLLLLQPLHLFSRLQGTLKVWQFLKKGNIPYDPGISLLGIHPRDLKTYAVHTKTCVQMFNGSIINNGQKIETIQMSINIRMSEQNVVYPHNRLLFSHKKVTT